MKTSATASWTKVIMLGVPLVLLAVNNCFAAPANSNEDQLGFVPSRQAFRTRENVPLAEYNLVPLVPETGIPLDTQYGSPQQPVDALWTYILSRHSGLNNRFRSYPDMDSARNELTRKRSSYSRYCAFNAVSCFGRKK